MQKPWQLAGAFACLAVDGAVNKFESPLLVQRATKGKLFRWPVSGARRATCQRSMSLVCTLGQPFSA